jgi:hypothetical protein
MGMGECNGQSLGMYLKSNITTTVRGKAPEAIAESYPKYVAE